MSIENIGLQKIVLDISKKLTQKTFYANEVDTNGRGWHAYLKNNGVAVDGTGVTLRFRYTSLNDGQAKTFDFTPIGLAANGEFEIHYPTEMVRGFGGQLFKCTIVASDATSDVAFENIYVYVNKAEVPTEGVEASNEFSTLKVALDKVDTWEGEFRTKYDGLEVEYAEDLTEVKTSLAHNVRAGGVPIEKFGGKADDPLFNNLTAYNAAIAYLTAQGGGTLLFGAGKYYFSAIPLKTRINLIGNGAAQTEFHAMSGNATGKFMYIDDAPIAHVKYEGFALKGNSLNVNQHGLYLKGVEQSQAPFTGGLWESQLIEILVTGFTGHQIYSEATDILGDVANQFLTFNHVMAWGNDLSNFDVFRSEGQAGQFLFINCEFDKAKDGYYNLRMTDAHATFITQSIQDAKQGVFLNGGVYTFINPWFENVEKAINTGVVSGVKLAVGIVGGNITNCGFNAGGDGYIISVGHDIDTSVSFTGNTRIWGATEPNIFIHDQGGGNSRSKIFVDPTIIVKATTYFDGQIFYQDSSSMNGMLTVNNDKRILCAGTVTGIINSARQKIIHVEAFGGTLTFSPANNHFANPQTLDSGKKAMLFEIQKDYYGIMVF